MAGRKNGLGRGLDALFPDKNICCQRTCQKDNNQNS